MAAKPKKRKLIPRKPGRPKTTGKNEMIAIRWPQDLMAAIERYAQKHRPALARGEALKLIVSQYLTAEGIIQAAAE